MFVTADTRNISYVIYKCVYVRGVFSYQNVSAKVQSLIWQHYYTTSL
jgi:hypothetical protein